MTTQDFKTLPAFIQRSFIMDLVRDTGIQINGLDARRLNREQREELFKSLNNLKGAK